MLKKDRLINAIHVKKSTKEESQMVISIAAKFERACDILDKYERNPHKLIPILQEMQAEYKYLPEEIMTFISVALGISPSTVYGVATFYAHFTLEPKGKYVIKVCDGTACHVKASDGILKALEKELGLNKENKTTKDMMFTLETVACLGACGLAPVVLINDRVHGLMTPESTIALLSEIKKEELGNET
jgi:NADH-quinone oxidoreductase subunit E